jgi:hypothetical protein
MLPLLAAGVWGGSRVLGLVCYLAQTLEKNCYYISHPEYTSKLKYYFNTKLKIYTDTKINIKGFVCLLF